MHSVQFHLYKIQYQAQVVCDGGKQKNGGLLRLGGHDSAIEDVGDGLDLDFCSG